MATVFDLEPVGFDLEKSLVAGEFFRRITTGGRGQAFLRVEFDFSD
jgi:hypothetical protein